MTVATPATQAERKWRRYPGYKDSGVEWLGEVPVHWDIRRLKYGTRINPDTLPEDVDRDYELEYIDIGNVDSVGNVLDTESYKFEDAPSRARRKVRDGDTFISTVRTYLRAIGYAENPSHNLVVSTGFAVLRPMEALLPRFLWRVVQSDEFVETVVANSDGVSYPAINPSRLGELPIWIPPLEEQCAIADFLDRETKRIDTLIARKERLIELLQEKRTALISHVVTKGLDPDVEMKDSEVEWLGEVPKHWDFLKLRRVVKKFVDYRGATPTKVDNGIPLITAKNIQGGEINFEISQEYIAEEDYDEWMVRGVPQLGDVLVTTEAPLGDVAQIVDPNIALAQRMILLKRNPQHITNEYLRYHFLSKSGQGELWSRATGSTALGIKASRLKETLVTVPPLHEQGQIVRLLNEESRKTEQLIEIIRDHNDRLLEYRTALISAAVTGEIDVRNSSPAGGYYDTTNSG